MPSLLPPPDEDPLAREMLAMLLDAPQQTMRLPDWLRSPAPPPPVAEKTDDTECSVCMAEENVAAFAPCGHQCVCMACAQRVMEQNRRCPVCREPCTGFLRIFRS